MHKSHSNVCGTISKFIYFPYFIFPYLVERIQGVPVNSTNSTIQTITVQSDGASSLAIICILDTSLGHFVQSKLLQQPITVVSSMGTVPTPVLPLNLGFNLIISDNITTAAAPSPSCCSPVTAVVDIIWPRSVVRQNIFLCSLLKDFANDTET